MLWSFGWFNTVLLTLNIQNAQLLSKRNIIPVQFNTQPTAVQRSAGGSNFMLSIAFCVYIRVLHSGFRNIIDKFRLLLDDCQSVRLTTITEMLFYFNFHFVIIYFYYIDICSFLFFHQFVRFVLYVVRLFDSAKSQRMLPLELCMRSNVGKGQRLFWSSFCWFNTTTGMLIFSLFYHISDNLSYKTILIESFCYAFM